MFDLSSVMFYNTKFRIRRQDENVDMLWELVFQIRRWMTEKHNKNGTVCLDPNLRRWSAFKAGKPIYSRKRFPGEKDIVLVSDYFRETDEQKESSAEYWACTITERFVPVNSCAPRIWTTELGYEQISADEAEISCVLSYSDHAGHIGPTEETPHPTIPRIIQLIICDRKLECSCGLDTPGVSENAVRAGDWYHIWNRLISAERRLPYIILNPKLNEENQPEFQVDPHDLAYAMCGNALVFYPENADSVRDMQEAFPTDYHCTTGYIRCYVPYCIPTQNKDSYRHRFLTSAEITALGAEGVIAIFRRALVQNREDTVNFFRMDDVKRRRDAQKHKLALQGMHQRYQKYLEEQKAAINENAEALLVEQIKKQEELEEERDEALLHVLELEDISEKLRRQIYQLRAQNDSMQREAERGRAAARMENAREKCQHMDSIFDVVLYFQETYSDRLVFNENAMKSLDTCTLKVGELWWWLYALAEYMYDLFADSQAEIEKKFKAKTGIECGRGEGSQTRQDKKLIQNYFTEYEGEKINAEMHLKSKNRLQALHFGFSQEKKKLIIHHCGAHMTNSLTRSR